MVEAEKKGINLEQYIIKIYEYEDHYNVLFKHKDKSPTQYGSPPGKPVYTVELDKKTLAFRKIVLNI